MTFKAAITPSPAAPWAASGVGNAVDIAQKINAQLTLNVTAVSGSAPTLSVAIESSIDGTTGWRTIDSFAAVSAVGVQTKRFAGSDQFLRTAWTITGGSPAFTFAVSGNAILVYAAPADLFALGIPQATLASVPSDTIARSLEAATDRLDRSIGAQKTLPLISWGDDIRRDCAVLAAFEALTVRGVNPTGSEAWFLQRYRELVGAPGNTGDLTRMARGEFVLQVVDSSPDEVIGGAEVWTDHRRGW